ncbi:DUF1150 family protein [Salinarimonas ramus]|uniref:DUF1150 domain-containing protein n=1 Tax=Salinarimonas ramus TaxID=690164 RepID=A0A917Q655_9HYPH|nr:DUF1150 domain-containing protein [Salinarimonas ramus]GGK27479.1 hypothetical protein GCM10011322_12550 [Salinarimonas ramus]
MTTILFPDTIQAPEALAALGEGEVAYVRPMTSEEVRTLFPQAPALQPGLSLYALLSASGAPILLTGSREAAFANARANQLDAVSVH